MVRRKVLWVGASFLGAAGAFAALWMVPDLEERPIGVRLDDVVAVRRGGLPDALRFAVAPVFSAEGTAHGYEPIARQLAQALGRPVRLVQRRSYQEVNDLLRGGVVQLALVCTGAYLQAQNDGARLEVLAVPYYGDAPTYRSYTIVRAGSALRTMEALADRPFAFTEPLSLSGYFYAMEWALEHGQDPHVFFRRATYSHGHAQSIEAVLSGLVDGAAVDSLVFDAEARRRPDLRKRLRIVHESPPMGASPVVVQAALGSDLKDRLRRAFLQLAGTEPGRRSLARAGVTRFGAPPPSLYADDERRFDALMRHVKAER